MDLTPIIPAERQVIQGYGDGHFRISGVVHEGSVIVLLERTLAWPVTTLRELTIETLGDIIDTAPKVELLLIGTGRQAGLITRELRESLRTHGIVVETMDTGAACRTYNILLAEERCVAAALIAVQ